MKLLGLPLLVWIVVAIGLGIALGGILPYGMVRLFATFNGVFGNLLQFLIPLIIVGLVTPAIADIGRGAGRLLLITVMLAYGSTILAGYLSFATSTAVFPDLMPPSVDTASLQAVEDVQPFFTIAVPPLFDVMSALVLAFVIGLGIASLGAPILKEVAIDFKRIIVRTIEVVILPLLPVYIFGIFLTMVKTGQAWRVLNVFVAIIAVIFVMHVVWLLLQYTAAGLLTRRNPLRLLYNMMPAYFTVLGTSSSVATIPVTLRQTQKNGVSEDVSGFVVPLCATIHLSGSCLKIVACAVALMHLSAMPYTTGQFIGFILMLGVMMVAAPGVPGGAIMAALGVLNTMLGFDEAMQAIMIALYITMDSFGTACNVTGDGAIALIVDKINGKKHGDS